MSVSTGFHPIIVSKLLFDDQETKTGKRPPPACVGLSRAPVFFLWRMKQLFLVGPAPVPARPGRPGVSRPGAPPTQTRPSAPALQQLGQEWTAVGLNKERTHLAQEWNLRKRPYSSSSPTGDTPVPGEVSGLFQVATASPFLGS